MSWFYSKTIIILFFSICSSVSLLPSHLACLSLSNRASRIPVVAQAHEDGSDTWLCLSGAATSTHLCFKMKSVWKPTAADMMSIFSIQDLSHREVMSDSMFIIFMPLLNGHINQKMWRCLKRFQSQKTWLTLSLLIYYLVQNDQVQGV